MWAAMGPPDEGGNQMSSAVISGHQRSSSWAAMGTPDEGGKSGPSVAIRTPSGSRVRFGHGPTTQRSVQHAHVESACTRSRAARRARVRSRCAARRRADAHKRRRATSHMHRHALQHERRIGDHQHKKCGATATAVGSTTYNSLRPKRGSGRKCRLERAKQSRRKRAVHCVRELWRRRALGC